MDAVEFIKIRARMCKAYNDCKDCGLCDFCQQVYSKQDAYQVAEQTIANVEQWSKEHPIKTRQSEFLKMYPNARIDDGVIFLGPCAIDKSHKCTLDCKKCCRDYWLKEIE